jgi:co-chaperonin GroES (HSP10)
MRTLRACGDNILVWEDPVPGQTLSGFWIPMRYRKKACTGWVVSVGPAVRKAVPELKEKMRVAFRPFAGNEGLYIDWVWNGMKLRQLKLHEMIAIIGKDSVDRVSAGA